MVHFYPISHFSPLTPCFGIPKPCLRPPGSLLAVSSPTCGDILPSDRTNRSPRDSRYARNGSHMLRLVDVVRKICCICCIWTGLGGTYKYVYKGTRQQSTRRQLLHCTFHITHSGFRLRKPLVVHPSGDTPGGKDGHHKPLLSN